MIGSAFDYVHMWLILRQIIPPSELYATPIAAPLVWDFAQLWQWEKFIHGMDGPTRRDYLRELRDNHGFELLKISLRLKKSFEGPRKQGKHFAVPSGLKLSAGIALEIMRMRVEILRGIPASILWYISSGFLKAKKVEYTKAPVPPRCESLPMLLT